MRDPAGYITFEDDFIIRHLYEPAESSHFLYSKFAQKLVEKGLLIHYEWLDSKTLRSPRIAFLTYPTEWSSMQFYAAAELTLKIKYEAVSEGWDLKDASVWNIVFDGLKPIFVDLLSFIPLRDEVWRAMGQFNRNFLFPLLLDNKNRMLPSQCIQLWRDGVSPGDARKLLGLSRFLTLFWPLMIESQNEFSEKKNKINSIVFNGNDLHNKRKKLHTGLVWLLESVNPAQKKGRPSVWSKYEIERVHYSENELSVKRKTISSWINLLRPEWVLDMGCNSGEFSDMAVDVGAKVICWDSDPQAMVSLILRGCSSEQPGCYFPIISHLDDLSGGRGWLGNEFAALTDRLYSRVDLVMMLAITHHLSIACGVPLERIFRFVASISRKSILLEILSEKDLRVIQLCRNHNKDVNDFTVEKQLLAAASVGFVVLDRQKLSPGGTRECVWMELASANARSDAN